MKTFDILKNKILHPYVSKKKECIEKMSLQTSYDTTNIISAISLNCTHEDVCAKEHVFKDIEMFMNYDGTTENTVFSHFKRSLQGSKCLLEQILHHPISNINILQERQKYYDILDNLTEEKKHHVYDILQKCSSLENDILWLFAEKDENLKDLFDTIYFKWWLLKSCNSSSYALTSTIFYKIVLSPIVGVLTPIMYVLVPYLVMRYKFNIKVGFVYYVKTMLSTIMSNDTLSFLSPSYGSKLKWLNRLSYVMSILFYFQGIFNSFELSKTYHKISKHICEKIQSLSEFLTLSQELLQIVWHDSISAFFDITELKNEISLNINTKKFSIFSNFGEQLKQFKELDIEKVKHILKKIYIADTLYSIYTFKKDMLCTNTLYITNDVLTLNVKQEIPTIMYKGLNHPCISRDKVVKNDITMTNNENAIITGPNAGGKSTFIKALLVNIIFSQTLGFSLCDSCSHTPFDTIHSQINLPDNKGHESLFEAEMYRCKHVLDMLKENKEKRFLIVMDEIFNSTNPVEGISGAYAVVKKISEYPNTILLFTTHYTYLTRLDKQTHKFKALKMNIIREGNDIIYPYTLEKGISKQYIALELLKKNGFDEDIIEEALRLKDKFTNS